MIPILEVANGLYGAWRLAWLDASGMQYFNRTVEGFWRSFFAAVLIAPPLAVLLGLRFAGGGIEAPFWRFASIELISYVVMWVAFPVIMLGVTRAMDRTANYIPYIVAYNWATVWQNVLFLPFAIMVELGLFGGALRSGLLVALMIIVLAYIFVVTRTALQVGAGAAAILVVIDLVISVFINGFSESLIRVG